MMHLRASKLSIEVGLYMSDDDAQPYGTVPNNKANRERILKEEYLRVRRICNLPF